MKVIGEGRLTFTEPRDEVPHKPGSDRDWQESVVLYVWDTEQQCYVFFRIGHEPNQGASGSIAIWCNIWADGQYYKNTEALPLRAEDRLADGFGGGGKMNYRYDGKHHWTYRDGEIAADLVMEDRHAPFDFLPVHHNLGEVAANHIEATGNVSGTITFKGKTVKVSNATGHRDHSWGVRRWESMLTHRWAPAIFGPDFVTHALAMLAPDGTLTQFGYIIRDDTLIVPKDVSVVCLIEADGMTNRGGVVNYTFESGEPLEVVYRNIVPSALSFHRGYPCNDPMSIVTCGGRTGVGLMENAENTMGGKSRPRQNVLISGYIDSGIFTYRNGSHLVQRQ
jgi:hypothetical protein